METLKIAIVDDHKLFRQGLARVLSCFSEFNVIIEAASGPELFTKIDTLLPDVVLLDLHMKEMNGKDVSNIIISNYPTIKIIVLSMDYSQKLILEMFQIGVHSYITKDTDQIVLKNVIEQVIDKGYYFTDDIAQVLRFGLRSNSYNKGVEKNVIIDSLNIDLTKRELEVLQLICDGFTTGQIADRLFINFRTVEGHRKKLLEKTKTNNSVSLALFAVRYSLIKRIY